MPTSPDFESIKHQNILGHDYWSARELMPLLGYGKNWQNFSAAIQKAIISCKENGQEVGDHFNASIKMVSIGSGAQRETLERRRRQRKKQMKLSDAGQSNLFDEKE